MQCVLHPNVTYRDIPGMLARQRQAVMQLIKSKQTNTKIFPGLTAFAEGASFIPIEDIEGVRAAGWQPSEELLGALPSTVVTCDKALMTWLKSVHRDVKNHRASWPFLEPVNAESVPDYHKVVKDPIDLRLIGARIKDKYYSSEEALVSDLFLMLENCRKYNDEGTVYFQCADELQQYIRQRTLMS